jgi:hypothetical protein
MRTITYDISKLLTDAKRNAFVVPRFQRDFVWKQPQVKLLIDSIARNYPIGSLLVLQENDFKDPFLHARPIRAVMDSESRDHESVDPAGQYYVLDGQQRLTSIVRALMKESGNQVYYFDLLKMKHFDTCDSTDWIVARDRQRAMPNRYLRAEVIVDRERCQVLVEEFFEGSDSELTGDRPKQREASAKVNRVFETIRNFQIPLVVIDRSESLEAICRIFETINSTGTRLTTFDLAVARFYPKPALSDLLDESKRAYPILTRYAVDGERLLQIIALENALDRHVYAEATRTAILGLKHDVIETLWGRAAKCLADAYTWAEGRGVAPGMFPNEALMVPLAVFFSRTTEKWRKTQAGFGFHLERWYLAQCLQQGARQASNYRVALTTAELIKWRQEEVVPEIPVVNLTAEVILNLRPSDSRYKAILAFLRNQAPKDLISDEDLSPDDVEDHHIFPSVAAKKYGLDKMMLDSIGNRILVTKHTNRKLADSLPRDYLGQLIRNANETGTLAERLNRLGSAAIDLPKDYSVALSMLDLSNAEEFIRKRARSILSLLERFLGASLKVGVVSDDDAD